MLGLFTKMAGHVIERLASLNSVGYAAGISGLRGTTPPLSCKLKRTTTGLFTKPVGHVIEYSASFSNVGCRGVLWGCGG